MTTRSRIRRVLDFGRLREALAAPGADPRTWLALGRISTETDAVVWVADVGWVADVVITSGELSQEVVVECRFPEPIGGPSGDGGILANPVRIGAEVLVGLPDGNANVAPMILGYLHNPDNQQAPSQVNDQDIDTDFAKEHHILVTDKRVEVQVGSTLRVTAEEEASLLAQNVVLADGEADQSYVRGDDQKDALDSFLDSFDIWVDLVKVSIDSCGPATPLVNTTILAATQTLRTQLAQALSSRIKGE